MRQGGGAGREAPPPDWQKCGTAMSKTDDIFEKVQAAQSLCSEDPEQAEVFLRSALRDADALGRSSATLHLQLAELLFRLRRTRQALAEVIEVLELDPFNLVALNLRQMLGRRLR